MDEADYELLPHQVLNELKQDIDALKKRLSQPDTKLNELMLEMESLKDNIHELNAIFQKVLDGTRTEDPSLSLRTAVEKLDAVVSQNETIARGMIAISDKLGEFMAKQGVGISMPRGASPYPVQHTMGMPTSPGPGRMAPRPSMSMGGPQAAPSMPSNQPFQSPLEDLDLPPPPPNPGAKKRVGVF